MTLANNQKQVLLAQNAITNIEAVRSTLEAINNGEVVGEIELAGALIRARDAVSAIERIADEK